MAFDQSSAPQLPFAPRTYDSTYINQLVRAITTYFSMIDSPSGMNMSSVTPNLLKTPYTDLTLVNGSNNDIQIPPFTFLRVTGPTANFDVKGFNSSPQGVNNGRWLVLHNPTSNNMTIHDEELGSLPENRISTMTGANINISGTGIVSFIYSVKDLRWLVISHQG